MYDKNFFKTISQRCSYTLKVYNCIFLYKNTQNLCINLSILNKKKEHKSNNLILFSLYLKFTYTSHLFCVIKHYLFIHTYVFMLTFTHTSILNYLKPIYITFFVRLIFQRIKLYKNQIRTKIYFCF